MNPRSNIVVVGPATWNHLIELDRLPEPVPHMQFARRSLHTVGGTSAGKALHLAALGARVELHALLGDDEDGHRIGHALARCGVAVHAHASAETERHVNLMTESGERVSLYVSTPSRADEDSIAAIERSLHGAEVAVIDLSELGATLIERRDASGWNASVWVDLHDYDGESVFHEPFVRAADVVLMNDDRTDDPWALMASCLRRGPRIAVCTLGARGAIALDADGRRAEVAAVPTPVVDTNGAGDAFAAGFLQPFLSGGDLEACLDGGASQAPVALTGDHLHPLVEQALAAG